MVMIGKMAFKKAFEMKYVKSLPHMGGGLLNIHTPKMKDMRN